MYTLPGTPVIRYGDELGMGDDLSLPERGCARTPMQWSNEPHAGFTKSDNPDVPVISVGPYGYERINAAIQRRHPDSLLNWTERIIRMRKEVSEFSPSSPTSNAISCGLVSKLCTNRTQLFRSAIDQLPV